VPRWSSAGRNEARSLAAQCADAYRRQDWLVQLGHGNTTKRWILGACERRIVRGFEGNGVDRG